MPSPIQLVSPHIIQVPSGKTPCALKFVWAFYQLKMQLENWLYSTKNAVKYSQFFPHKMKGGKKWTPQLYWCCKVALPPPLLFTLPWVLILLDFNLGPQLLNICQSAKGKSLSGWWRCIIIESQLFIHSLPAELLSNAYLFDDMVSADLTNLEILMLDI